jgi:hemoglobin
LNERSAGWETTIVNGLSPPEALDERMIRAVVHDFYAAVRRDDLLGPIFNRAIAPDAWPAHLDKLCDFWSGALLRTSRYAGRPLQPHLSIPELGEEHFRRWLKLFSLAVRRNCPPDVAALFIGRALRIAHSFRLALAYNRGENTVDIEPFAEETLSASQAEAEDCQPGRPSA